MENNNLKQTKIKLSLLFVMLVFSIALILEILFFWIKYVNINYWEKRDFGVSTQMFLNNLSESNLFLNLLLSEKIIINHKWPRDSMWPGLKFLNFFITDKSWNVVVEKISQEIDEQIDYKDLDYNVVFDKWEYYIKKVYIWDKYREYKDIIFLKKQMYSLENFLEDLFAFILINIIFSVIIYYIWYIFVNKNLKPVEKILSDLTDFIHNANHELKTPIAIINSNLQLLKTTKNYEEDLIDNSIFEIKRIDDLINSLSNLSNINVTKDREDLSLNKEISEIINEFSSILKEEDIKLNYKKTFDTTLKANKEYFYILFSNLLRNAIKYNHKKWEINIVLNKNKLSISNTWEWIKVEDLDKIFDRFYKCDSSRNSAWFGIWLSLVKKICDIYDWQIKVNSEIWKITTFEINFKK